MEHYLPYLNWLDHKTDQMKDLVILWANINTHCQNFAGLATIMEHLKKQFAVLQGEIKEIDLPPYTVVDEHGNKTNTPLGKALHISKRPDAPIKILLNGHMDTVFGKHSPFQTVHESDHNTLVGPGVCDMKSGLVILLYALQALEKSPYASKVGWEVIITPDEEIGSPGSHTILEQAARRHHMAMIFEPAHADGAIVTTRPGSSNIVIVVRGKSAHAGRDFTQGRSALLHATHLATSIEKLSTLKPGAEMPTDTLGDHVIVNIGEIRSGHSFNIVPDLAILRVNIRASSPQGIQDTKKKIEEIIKTQPEGIWTELHEQSTRPPKIIDNRTQLLYDFAKQTAEALKTQLIFRASGGASDGNTTATAGLITLDSLGAIGGKMHTHDEYVVIDSLPQRAKLASLLLMRIGNGEFAIDSKNQTIEL